MMSECYYLSTHEESSIISVRRYSDNSVVKSYQEATWPMGDIRLIGITDSLVIVYLKMCKTAFVYTFDCFDPCSLKRCYPFDVEHYQIATRHRRLLGDRLILFQRYETSVKYTAWKFNNIGYNKIAEWTLPLGWTRSEVIKLSDNQLLSISMGVRSEGQSNDMYLTTFDTPSDTLSSGIVSSPIREDDLERLGVGVLGKIRDQFTDFRYYPNHRLILAYTMLHSHLYQKSNESNDWKRIKTSTVANMNPTSIIDGNLRVNFGYLDHTAVTLPKFETVSTIRALSCFYAYPSRNKIEQLYLPILLPVFKGCRDLALLVASYLQWDNDIVN